MLEIAAVDFKFVRHQHLTLQTQTINRQTTLFVTKLCLWKDYHRTAAFFWQCQRMCQQIFISWTPTANITNINIQNNWQEKLCYIDYDSSSPNLWVEYDWTPAYFWQARLTMFQPRLNKQAKAGTAILSKNISSSLHWSVSINILREVVNNKKWTSCGQCFIIFRAKRAKFFTKCIRSG